jgi:putative flippase GtrA
MTGLTQSVRDLIGSKRHELVRFAKFCVVGAIGAIVDFGMLNLGVKVFFRNLSLEPRVILLLANTISFSAAVISNFTWNRYWTYPESRQQRWWPQLGQFALVNVAGWGINTGILLGLNPLASSMIGKTWGYNLAKAAATAVVLFWNFGINRVWTYGEIR